MPKVELKEMHKTIGDLGKPAANVPVGVWHKLRAIKLSQKDKTITPKDGSDEYETVEYTLSVEPITPGPGVDPVALVALDERTGKPTWDGKRIFCRFTESFRAQMQQLSKALTAMGFDEGEKVAVWDAKTEKFVPGPLITENKVRGKVFSGAVRTRDFKRNDGTDGTDQYIENFAPAGSGGPSFVL